MKPKQLFKDYFVFTRKERLIVIFSLVLFLCILLLPDLLSKETGSDTVQASPEILAAIDTLTTESNERVPAKEQDEDSEYSSPANDNAFSKGELFNFDPNTISATEWQRLGLKERTIKTILNYRAKGGNFYRSEDLKKIWGLPNGFYERVSSYITIQNPHKGFNPEYTKNSYEKNTNRISAVDINTADTSTLIALPGIGNKLATRIVNFRDKLGGFHTIEQVKETYGLPDSSFQKVRPHLLLQTANKKININTASKDELQAHPYIKWNLANAMVEYRNQHGPFQSLEDVKKIVLIDESTLQKLQPYLKF